jgi:hypothetical protein
MPAQRQPRREEWQRIQSQGMQRFLVIGALRRALPMTGIALVLLEVFEPGSFTRERLVSSAFLGRVLFALTLFLIGGAISSYARWKSFQALYGDRST